MTARACCESASGCSTPTGPTGRPTPGRAWNACCRPRGRAPADPWPGRTGSDQLAVELRVALDLLEPLPAELRHLPAKPLVYPSSRVQSAADRPRESIAWHAVDEPGEARLAGLVDATLCDRQPTASRRPEAATVVIDEVVVHTEEQGVRVVGVRAKHGAPGDLPVVERLQDPSSDIADLTAGGVRPRMPSLAPVSPDLLPHAHRGEAEGGVRLLVGGLVSAHRDQAIAREVLLDQRTQIRDREGVAVDEQQRVRRILCSERDHVGK